MPGLPPVAHCCCWLAPLAVGPIAPDPVDSVRLCLGPCCPWLSAMVLRGVAMTLPPMGRGQGPREEWLCSSGGCGGRPASTSQSAGRYMGCGPLLDWRTMRGGSSWPSWEHVGSLLGDETPGQQSTRDRK